MAILETILTFLFTQMDGAISMLVALAQVNTGFFGVSITLLTILPSLIELVKDKSAHFIEQTKMMRKLDKSLKLFRFSTVALGLSALLSAVLTIYPVRIGIIIVLVITVAGTLLLAVGGYRIAEITRQSLVREK